MQSSTTSRPPIRHLDTLCCIQVYHRDIPTNTHIHIHTDRKKWHKKNALTVGGVWKNVVTVTEVTKVMWQALSLENRGFAVTVTEVRGNSIPSLGVTATDVTKCCNTPLARFNWAFRGGVTEVSGKSKGIPPQIAFQLDPLVCFRVQEKNSIKK